MEKLSECHWKLWPLLFLLLLGGCASSPPNKNDEIYRQQYLTSSLNQVYSIAQSKNTEVSPAQYYVCSNNSDKCPSYYEVDQSGLQLEGKR